MLEDVIYILLFLVFMLVESIESDDDEPTGHYRATAAEQKIFDYIGGKVRGRSL